MRFQLVKNLAITFTEQVDRKPRPADILFSPKTAILKTPVSSFTALVSEKKGSTAANSPVMFWSPTVMAKCKAALMAELNKDSKTFDPCIVIQLISKRGNGKFSVQIRDCALMTNLYKVCGANVKLLVEINFLGVHGVPTMAGLVTREMSMGQDAPDRTKVSCLDTKIAGTKALREFWEVHTCSFRHNVDRFQRKVTREAKPMSALCSVILIVEDKWPVFQRIFTMDRSQNLLERGNNSDMVVSSFEGSFASRRSIWQRKSALFRNIVEIEDQTNAEKPSYGLIIADEDNSNVHALLKYVHYEELPKENEVQKIFDLLLMAQRLRIFSLEHAAAKALTQAKDSYFKKDLAEKVLKVARAFPGWVGLEKKMAKIVASEEPILNPKYRELHRNDLPALMDLLKTEDELKVETEKK